MVAWEESPRQFKMSKQLDEGKIGEDLARKFLNDPIIKVNHGISHYDDVTQDRTYQDKDTDFIVWKKNGKTFGLEAKVDSHNTGNLYLETSVDYFTMVPDALNEQRVARRYQDGIDPLWHTPAGYIGVAQTRFFIISSLRSCFTSFPAWMSGSMPKS